MYILNLKVNIFFWYNKLPVVGGMDVVVDINVVVGNVTVVAAEKYERSPDSDFHDSMIYLIYTFNYTAIIYLHNDVNIDINDKQFIC